MLLGLANRIDVDIAPGHVTVRGSRWPFRQSKDLFAEVIPAFAGMPPWQGAVESLGKALAGRNSLGGALSITLSSRFVRYLLVPERTDIGASDERIEYARHYFVEHFGADAEDWIIQMSEKAVGEQAWLACAVERQLLEQLSALAARQSMTLELVQPVLVRAFNESREALAGKSCWLAAVETDIAAIALIDDGTWRGVAARRLRGPVGLTLNAMIATEQQVIGVESPPSEVLIARFACHDDIPPMLPGAAKVRCPAGVGFLPGEQRC